MKITAKLDYTCRILCELARSFSGGDTLSIEQLSRTESVPANFLAQILGDLRHGRLVVSRRGIQGGFRLARAPGEITLFDIINVIEGELLAPATEPGGRSGRALRQIWDEIGAAISEKARGYTLEAMASRIDAEMYYI
ncbi:MAG TPA: Rrf2 family transcriptional regulator [Candidatus Didemnitutus sp.]|nr:Rrf2 family transcriptional regulator [Candidatus Didemnitutus sp.]